MLSSEDSEFEDVLRDPSLDAREQWAKAAFQAPLEFALNHLLEYVGASAGDGVVRLTHQLFSEFQSYAKRAEALAPVLKDPAAHPVQKAVSVAFLNEFLRNSGPRSDLFGKVVDAFGGDIMERQPLHAAALQGLYDPVLVEACYKKLCRFSGYDQKSIPGLSARLASLLLASFRRPDGMLEDEALEIIRQFPSSPVDDDREMILTLQAFPHSILTPEEWYLDGCRRVVRERPEMERMGDKEASPADRSEILRGASLSFLRRWGERAMEGVALLLAADRRELAPEEEAEIVEDVSRGSGSWEERFVDVCRLSGRSLHKPGPLLSMLLEDDDEEKILASIALWDPEMGADLKHDLWVIGVNRFVGYTTSGLVGYILGGARNVSFADRFESTEDLDLPYDNCEKMIEGFKKGRYSKVPAGVSMYAKMRESRTLDFVPYEYQGFRNMD